MKFIKPFLKRANTTTRGAGEWGEEAAARYLEQQGYEIIKRNFRSRVAEVDLIAQKEGTLCFIEVKTRKNTNYGQPEEFVDYRKRKKIIQGARIFSGRPKYSDMYIRFDIISVVYAQPKIKIRHIPNAFEEE